MVIFCSRLSRARIPACFASSRRKLKLFSFLPLSLSRTSFPRLDTTYNSSSLPATVSRTIRRYADRYSESRILWEFAQLQDVIFNYRWGNFYLSQERDELVVILHCLYHSSIIFFIKLPSNFIISMITCFYWSYH